MTLDRLCRPLGDPFSHIYWPYPQAWGREVALGPSHRLSQLLPQTFGGSGDLWKNCFFGGN